MKSSPFFLSLTSILFLSFVLCMNYENVPNEYKAAIEQEIGEEKKIGNNWIAFSSK